MAWVIKCPFADETTNGNAGEIVRDWFCANEITEGASVTRMAHALAPSPRRSARSGPVEGAPGWRPSNRLPGTYPWDRQPVGSV